MLGPFSIILKYFFHYLTGKQFQTITGKSWFSCANPYQKQEKSYCGPTGE